MDPKHRDRLAYKIVSGTLKETNRITMFVKKKESKIFKSERLFAEKKEIVDISYPGDIKHDTGNFKIGDIL
jgi:peptide chain release factor 3